MSYKDSHKWVDFASNYDRNISGKFEDRIYQIEYLILTEVLNQLFVNKDISVMDFACGTGRVTGIISKVYPNTMGFDISEDMLAVARQKYPQLKFLKKDITNDDMDKRFDLITAFRFFLNAEYELKELILSKFNDLLQNDGYIVFNIHMNNPSILFILSRIKYLLWLTKIKQNGMSYTEVKKLAEKCGFHIVYSRWYSFLLGNPLLTFLPFGLLKSIDLVLSKIPVLRFFSKDLIYVLKKSNEK